MSETATEAAANPGPTAPASPGPEAGDAAGAASIAAATQPPSDERTGSVEDDTHGIERQKREVRQAARATIMRAYQRQLVAPDGSVKEPITTEEKRLALYNAIQNFQEGDNITYNPNSRNPTAIEGLAVPGGKTYGNNELAIGSIVGVKEDGSLKCTLWETQTRRPVTRSIKDAAGNHIRSEEVVVAFTRTTLQDAQFAAERADYKRAVGPAGEQLLDAHAATMPQTQEEFVSDENTDKMIAEAASAANLITPADVLTGEHFNSLPQPAKDKLTAVLSGSTILTAHQLREVTAALGWNQLGVRRENDKIVARLDELKGRNDELSNNERTSLQEQQALLTKVHEALKPGEDGSTQVDALLQKQQNGELTDAISKGLKDAIATGDAEHIFKAIDISGEGIDSETKNKMVTAAKYASIGGIGFAALILLLTGAVISVAGKGMANAGK